MRFEGVVEVAVERRRVWELLTDPRRLAKCMPDVQSMTVHDPSRFTVAVRVGVGPIRATFTVNATFVELRGCEYAVVEARGQAPGSVVDMRSVVVLAEPSPGRTNLQWSSEVRVSGMIASVGGSVMRATADRMTQQIFASMKSELEATR